MTLRNTPSSYGSFVRAFHWGMALLLVVAIVLIELTELAPKGSALRRGMREWHSQAGLLVLALVWFRFAWKLVNTEPAIVPPPVAWQRKAAHAVEWTFYALMVALPVLGIVMRPADGRPVARVGVAPPAWPGTACDLRRWQTNTSRRDAAWRFRAGL